MPVFIFAFALACQVLGADINAIIVDQVRQMPSGGGYKTNLEAHTALARAMDLSKGVRIHPERAMPAYCSGATYLIFLKTLLVLQEQGELSLSDETWKALAPKLRDDGKDTLPDGQSLWGRWNANGPGTARLFHELGLGSNFTSFAHARPGDFMKIFWTPEVGKNERGHSVIFLGLHSRDGIERVRFWSSNVPEGFGDTSVPRAKIVRVIFSRLEHPKNVARWRRLANRDEYLAKLLHTPSTFAEAIKMTGTRDAE